jgi:AraC-like DNA-binding protein
MDEICYREYPIPTALTPFVKLIWSLECDRSIHHADPERILPDGCVELVFHFRDPFYTAFANHESHAQPQGFVVGQMNEFIEIAPHGRVGFVAVRFSAQGAYRFLPGSLKRIAGGVVATRDIWKDSDSEIIDRIATARTMSRRIAFIEHLLKKHLAFTQREDILVDRALELIQLHAGTLRITELASAVGASARQLNRRFESAVGVAPKQFSRVSRFVHALDEMRSHRKTSLTEVALNCGYFDQAHFNHEFRQFTGFHPTELFTRANVAF